MTNAPGERAALVSPNGRLRRGFKPSSAFDGRHRLIGIAQSLADQRQLHRDPSEGTNAHAEEDRFA
jgi:hypothetical protein